MMQITNKLRTVLVFLVLLAYGTQSLAFGPCITMPKSTSTESTSTNSSCHGEQSASEMTEIISDDDTVSSVSSMKCCEKFCSMIGFHAASVMLSTFHISPLLLTRESHELPLTIGFIETSLTSLFRPPILC